MARSLSADDAMQELYAELGVPEKEDDEFTLRMYAERYSLPFQTADHHLVRALRRGKLTRRLVSYRGKRCWAYRWISANAESYPIGE